MNILYKKCFKIFDLYVFACIVYVLRYDDFLNQKNFTTMPALNEMASTWASNHYGH